MALTDELTAFFDDYIAKWNRNDAAGLKAMWDMDEPEPIYVAEEREPLIGWPAKTFSAIDRSGNNPGCWCTTAIPRCCARDNEQDSSRSAIRCRWRFGASAT